MAGQVGYSDTELRQLHTVLHSILAEIVRVCDILDIPYFIIGGTAIGAFFWNDIIPWDDDIDVGMKRENYDKFLREAPKLLRPEFFLQWYGSEPHTPFYFAKVRKNGTVFQEEISSGLNIHQGIYVDIFPFDKIPDNSRKRKLQRKAALFLNACFVCKEKWPYKHFGKCSIGEPWIESRFRILIKRLASRLISKRLLFSWFCKIENKYNKSDVKYYNQVMMKSEFIPVEEIDKTSSVLFGGMKVAAPLHIDTYLKCHYGHIEKFPPKEMRVTHRPLRLSFSTK